MRPWPFVLVLVCCSKPQPVTPVADETKPISASSPLIGKRRFVMASTHEISCSQSFERHGLYVTFDLAIDSAGQATLRVDGAAHKSFGASEARFSPGAKVHQESKPIAELWSGTARMVGQSVHVDLSKGSALWKLACGLRRVDARRPYTADANANANANESVEVLACTPTRHVAEGDEKHIGALLFAPFPGVKSSVDQRGWGGRDTFDLRILRD